MRATRRTAFLLLLVALLTDCGGGSSSKKADERPRQPVLRTPANDRQAGEEAAQQVAAQMGIVRDPALSAYVNQVGQRVARNAPSGGFSYSFQIVDQDAPNAFALPGGFIYVSRGLLAMSNSEAELANVLGHEVVHVARRHAAGRQAIQSALPGFLGGRSAMAQAAAYGRDQERESDRLGQGLAALAGYDPQGLADFLTQLEYSERLRLGFSRMQGYFDSHPATRERVAAAGARARSISWRPRPGVEGRSAYLRRLNGLVVGTAAAEGVFQGERFLHPDLGFSMLFPSGWHVINSKRAVGAVSRTRDAQVVLEFQSAGNDPEAAANEYIEQYREKGLRVEALQRVKIGGLPAVRATGRAVMGAGGRSAALHLTWIARDGSILRLTGISIRGSKAGIFNNVARSFRPLSPSQLASIRETRIQIVQANEGETFAELSRRTNNEWNLQETAVMNGFFANTRLEAGTAVKVAVSRPYRVGSLR
ncbi:MAG: M48 family metalloprotease [Myxococcota bacterium]|nr:M48 family metalloprotease [Myxococcota bacterium]